MELYRLTLKQLIRSAIVKAYRRIVGTLARRPLPPIEIRRLDESKIHHGNPAGAGW